MGPGWGRWRRSMVAVDSGMGSKKPRTARAPAGSRPARSRPADPLEHVERQLEEIREQGRAVRAAIDAQGAMLGAKIDALRAGRTRTLDEAPATKHAGEDTDSTALRMSLPATPGNA